MNPLIPRADIDWMARGACLGYDPDGWFDHGGEKPIAPSETTRLAVEICQACPVKTKCLDTAMTTGERWGVWGGTTHVERAQMRRDAQQLVFKEATSHGTD